mmetsp:Transcript_3196/g.3816  ORF Transcript_3196/g.3816 Transcript_3196/m.3816 type:complete len:95 (+) Transcript_3196:302-586(+)
MPSIRFFGIYYYDCFSKDEKEDMMKFLDVPPAGPIQKFELNCMGDYTVFKDNCVPTILQGITQEICIFGFKFTSDSLKAVIEASYGCKILKLIE